MYVYLIQPRAFNGCSNVYKIGMSSKCDLSRLRSYGLGTRYICMMEVENYLETERRLKSAFGYAFTLDHGNEYYRVDNEETAIQMFTSIASEMRNTKCKSDMFSNSIQRYALKSHQEVGCKSQPRVETFADRIAKFKFGSI